jgi:hypothetical protein
MIGGSIARLANPSGVRTSLPFSKNEVEYASWRVVLEMLTIDEEPIVGVVGLAASLPFYPYMISRNNVHTSFFAGKSQQ